RLLIGDAGDFQDSLAVTLDLFNGFADVAGRLPFNRHRPTAFAAAMWTRALLGVDVFVAGSAQHQPPTFANLVVATQGTRHTCSVGPFQPHLNSACRKWVVRSLQHRDEG